MRFLCVDSLTARSFLTFHDEEHGETDTARNENKTANWEAYDKGQARCARCLVWWTWSGSGNDIAGSVSPASNGVLVRAKSLVAAVCGGVHRVNFTLRGCSAWTSSSTWIVHAVAWVWVRVYAQKILTTTGLVGPLGIKNFFAVSNTVWRTLYAYWVCASTILALRV